MKLLAALLALFREPSVELIDHAPVSGNVTAKKIARARAEAAKRHGKQFLTDQIKDRETPKSRYLEELEAAPKQRSASVTKIKESQ